MTNSIICKPECKRAPNPEGNQPKVLKNLKLNHPGEKFEGPLRDLSKLSSLVVSNSTCDEEFIHMQQEVLAIVQTFPCSAKRLSEAILLPRTTLARRSKDLCWAAVALAVDSATISGMKKFLIIVSFIFIPNQGSRNLPKGMDPES